MKIIPLKGFDKITFGLTQDAAIKILGQPTENRKEEYEDGSQQVILDYEELGFDLSFSEDDGFLLGAISFYSTDFTFENEVLIGMSEAGFLKKMKSLGYDDLTLEDSFEDIGSKDYYSPRKGISFWIQDGIVDSITIFPDEDFF